MLPQGMIANLISNFFRKVSKVEKKANRLVFIVLFTQMVVCLICSIGIMVFTVIQ
jgi:hypothetical protein